MTLKVKHLDRNNTTVAKPVWVIIAIEGSCIINAIYLDRGRAHRWVSAENKRLGFQAYYIEQSQLIK